MNSAVGLWVAAEWRRRWPALLGIAVLVALAGGVATALAAGARRADTAYLRFREATGEPNLAAHIDLDGIETAGVHVEAIDELAVIDGVEAVEVESWWAIELWPEEAPDVVVAFATGTFATAGEVGEPIVLDGVLPDVDDPDSVTINEEATEFFDVEVGDTLTFATASPARLAEWATNDGQFGSSDALDGPTIEVEVAAVIRTEGDLESPFPMVDFPEGFARAHADDIAHVETFVNLRVDEDRLGSIAGEVEEVLAPYDLDVAPLEGIGVAIVPSIDVGVSTLWIATAVAAFGGLLLVAQALGRVVAGSSADHSALDAMGLTRSQRTAGTAAVGLVGVLAGSLAVPLVAWSLSWLFPRGTAALAEPHPGLRWDGQTLATGAAADTPRRVARPRLRGRCIHPGPAGAVGQQRAAHRSARRQALDVARRILRRRSRRLRSALALARRRRRGQRRRGRGRRARRGHAGLVTPPPGDIAEPVRRSRRADLREQRDVRDGRADRQGGRHARSDGRHATPRDRR